MGEEEFGELLCPDEGVGEAGDGDGGFLMKPERNPMRLTKKEREWRKELDRLTMVVSFAKGIDLHHALADLMVFLGVIPDTPELKKNWRIRL